MSGSEGLATPESVAPAGTRKSHPRGSASGGRGPGRGGSATGRRGTARGPRGQGLANPSTPPPDVVNPGCDQPERPPGGGGTLGQTAEGVNDLCICVGIKKSRQCNRPKDHLQWKAKGRRGQRLPLGILFCIKRGATMIRTGRGATSNSSGKQAGANGTGGTTT